MKTALISIGNSRGIRIPKPLIEQCGLHDEVELDVRDKTIIIHSPKTTRAGWDNAFAQMARLKDDALIQAEATSTLWDSEEWEWR
ncbi:MAG TPA: AbrB/MazE/SpoVT family DNA-binding domain-containing protein [Kiritimatiellia bacterium]|nr:AbrB/MazE/SpoVT family DNA-binding domain-containing protein [Kiritimatiellia bacterium]HMP34796.1 AbrB/MazE/SpoVT family DNA-binding domain-containing protein [Kiritimatiellia bacterium]